MATIPDEPGSFRRAVLAWRHWRHTRPFLGGLLVLLGGILILLTERAPLPVVIHIGLQGLAGYLVPIIMVLCGLLLWFHPVQRMFYSILAVILSLGSWITSNLGGFFVGMLLGLIGGGLAFAWVQREWPEPAARHSPPPPPQRTRSVGLDLFRGRRSAEDRAGVEQAVDGPAAEGRATDDGPARDGRADRRTADRWIGPAGSSSGGTATLTMPRVPLAPLALSMLAAVAARGLMTGSMPAPALAASPSLAAPGPPAAPLAIPSPSSSPPLSSPSPSPSPSASSSPSPSPSSSTPSSSPSSSPSPPNRPPPVRVAGAAGLPDAPVAADPASLASRFAVLTGLSYDGIATVPTAHGKEKMLKFSMSTMTLPAIVLTATRGGQTFITRDSGVELTGNVELYTTKISGNLGGVRVTFTSAKPPAGLPADMTLTDVVAEQPFAAADSLHAASSLVTAG